MSAVLRRSSVFTLFGLAAIVLGGCSLLSTRSLSEARFFETREAAMAPAAAHRACRQALETMGFEHRRGSPGTGELEMASRVLPGSGAQPVRQRRALVAVAMGEQGETLVKVGFWEESEAASPVDSTPVAGRLLRGGEIYGVFWRHFEAAARAEGPPLPDRAGG
jgi:hypothetical protein